MSYLKTVGMWATNYELITNDTCYLSMSSSKGLIDWLEEIQNGLLQ
jgi:hypothetical protein